MTQEELKQAAIDYLGRAFRGKDAQVQLVQAAVSIVLASIADAAVADGVVNTATLQDAPQK